LSTKKTLLQISHLLSSPQKKKKDPTSDSETSDPKITVEVQTEDTTNKKEETFL